VIYEKNTVEKLNYTTTGFQLDVFKINDKNNVEEIPVITTY
jgi:hypothetical protein